jgi:hypothetical protein
MSDQAETAGSHLVKLEGVQLAGYAIWVECKDRGLNGGRSVASQAATVRHMVNYLIRRETHPFESKAVSHVEGQK